MSAATIPLMTQAPPVVSPLTTVGGLMQLRSQITENALRAAQVQQTQQATAQIQAKTAEENRQLQQRQKLQDIWADPANHAAFSKGDYTPIWSAGVAPDVAEPLISSAQKIAQAAQGLEKGKAEIHLAGRQAWAKAIQNVDPDDPEAASQLNSMRENLATDYPDTAKLIQPYQQNGLADRIHADLVSNQMLTPYLEAKVAQDKAKSEATEAALKPSATAADTALKTSQLGGVQAESQIKQAEAAALTAAPEDQAAQVARSIDPQKYPDIYKRTVANAAAGITHQEKLAAIEKGSAEVAEREKETDPAIIRSRVNQQVQVQRALNATSALGNVPPHLVAPALAEANKADTEYSSSINAANEMQSMVDMMRSGNKVAYAYSPVTGVLTVNAGNGVKRVNIAEIKQYGGTGSALDRIEGWLGKNATGESIPPDVVNDMESFHHNLATVSGTTYGNRLKQINSRYGSTLQPVDLQGTTKPKKSLDEIFGAK